MQEVLVVQFMMKMKYMQHSTRITTLITQIALMLVVVISRTATATRVRCRQPASRRCFQRLVDGSCGRRVAGCSGCVWPGPPTRRGCPPAAVHEDRTVPAARCLHCAARTTASGNDAPRCLRRTFNSSSIPASESSYSRQTAEPSPCGSRYILYFCQSTILTCAQN